jgi:hypothetical protein
MANDTPQRPQRRGRTTNEASALASAARATSMETPSKRPPQPPSDGPDIPPDIPTRVRPAPRMPEPVIEDVIKVGNKVSVMDHSHGVAPEGFAPSVITVGEDGAILVNGRPRRPFGSMDQRLNDDKRPGYHRHWFNDAPGRIKDALQAGYNFVLDETGKPMTAVVGTRREGPGALIAYRMEIPMEWFQADKDAVQSRVDEIEQQMVNGEAFRKEMHIPVDSAGRPRTRIVTTTSRGGRA